MGVPTQHAIVITLISKFSFCCSFFNFEFHEKEKGLILSLLAQRLSVVVK